MRNRMRKILQRIIGKLQASDDKLLRHIAQTIEHYRSGEIEFCSLAPW